MKYYLFCLLLFSNFTFVLEAQEFSKNFGIVAKNTIELEKYAADTTAEAVILFDLGKSYFIAGQEDFYDYRIQTIAASPGQASNTRPDQATSNFETTKTSASNGADDFFNVVLERRKRIKILSEEGLKWAEISIPFYQQGGVHEIIYDLEAYTYNYEDAELKKTKLDITTISEEKISESWLVKKFKMPNVKKGSIIEYKYKINSQYTFNLRDWEFQSEIPTMYSEYEVRMIPFYEYSWFLQGKNDFTSQKTYLDQSMTRVFGKQKFNDMVHRYILEDVPAFKNEKFLSSRNDYIIKIDFQLAQINYSNGTSKPIGRTWEELIIDLKKHSDFGRYIKRSEKLARKVLNLKDLLDKNPKERFDFILKYVKNNYTWNKESKKYASQTPNNLIKTKIGNSADINLFTLGLLKAAGVLSYPVISSTRQNGKVKSKGVYEHSLNYVLICAKIHGKQVLSDATEKLNLTERLPLRAINGKGLLVTEEKEEWIDLRCYTSSEEKNKFVIKLSEKGLNAAISKSFTEYDALNYRKNFGEDKAKIKEILKQNNTYKLGENIEIKNYSNIEKPYTIEYTLSSQSEISDEKISISPFLDEVLNQNPLTEKTRRFPMDMIYPSKKSYHAVITIPEGYAVESFPKADNIKNNLFEFDYSVKNEGNKIEVFFNYAFKQDIYPADYYSRIKFYFKQIVKLGDKKIVLKKKVF